MLRPDWSFFVLWKGCLPSAHRKSDCLDCIRTRGVASRTVWLGFAYFWHFSEPAQKKRVVLGKEGEGVREESNAVEKQESEHFFPFFVDCLFVENNYPHARMRCLTSLPTRGHMFISSLSSASSSTTCSSVWPLMFVDVTLIHFSDFMAARWMNPPSVNCEL